MPIKRVKLENLTRGPIGFPVKDSAGGISSLIYIKPGEVRDFPAEGYLNDESVRLLVEEGKLREVKATPSTRKKKGAQ